MALVISAWTIAVLASIPALSRSVLASISLAFFSPSAVTWAIIFSVSALVRSCSWMTLALASERSAWALAVSCSCSRVRVSSSAILAFWIGSRTWLGT